MARFDVYTYNNLAVPLVLDVQANLLSDLNTRAVIPLTPKKSAGDEIVPKLKPVIEINGTSYILMTTDLATIPKMSMLEFVTNVEDEYRQVIVDSLDFLFQGF